MPKVTTFLWFNDNAEQAAHFYMSVFDKAEIKHTMRSKGPDGSARVLGVTFRLFGQEYTAFNGGPHKKLDEAVSLFVSVETQQELDTIWAKLLAGGGHPTMCGWLTDQFGLSWQVIPTQLGELLQSSDPARATRAMQAMLKMQKLDIAALQAAADGR